MSHIVIVSRRDNILILPHFLNVISMVANTKAW
jgi:hypothetical protein